MARAACALLGGWLLLGCGMDMSGEDSNNNQISDGGIECRYQIQVSPLMPQIGDQVSLTVVEDSGSCAPGGYTWSIRDPDDQLVTPTLLDGDRVARFEPATAGTYRVLVIVNDRLGGEQHVDRQISVSDPWAQQRTYLLRFTPPDGAGAPRQQKPLVVYGSTPVDGRVITLDEGLGVTGILEGPSGPIAGYLRLIQAGFPLHRELHVGSGGTFHLALLPGAMYDVMIVPEGASPAPARILGQSAEALQQPGAFTLTRGEAVVGYVLGSSGQPVAGAQVVLRSDDLPSGVGQADIVDGRFTLLARPGSQAVEVVPPPESGFPRVVISDSSGIQLEEGHDLGLSLSYGSQAHQSLSLQVLAGDDAAAVPVVGARVTLEASDLGIVGALQVSRDGVDVLQVPAPGSFRTAGVTGGQGWLDGVLVPAGRYRVVIEAPADVPGGYHSTVIPVVDSTTLSADGRLRLAQPTWIEGWVADPEDVPIENVRVVAVTRLGVGSASSGYSDGDGYFRIPAIAGATYSVRLEPPTGSDLARRIMSGVVPRASGTILAGDGSSGEIRLPPGLRISGVVMLGATGLGRVLLQAIPGDEPAQPVLAETVTDAAGEFVLTIPDPGRLPE